MRLHIVLNGTDKNPFEAMGLKQNPFPQVANYRYQEQTLRLQKLGADPIPNTDYIRKTLEGFSQEFIDLCCQKFEKGRTVEFDVHFKEAR